MERDSHKTSRKSPQGTIDRGDVVFFFIFILLLVAALFVIGISEAHAQEPQAYYSQNDIATIWRSRLDGSNKEAIYAGWQFRPNEIALDNQAGSMYWTDHDAVFKADLDGSNVERLLEGLGATGDIALDQHGKVYWVGGHVNTIKRAGLDGSNPEEITSSDTRIEAIAIDAPNEMLYWATRNQISRSNLDGTNPQPVLAGLSFNRSINLAVDPANERIYFTGSSQHAIEWIRFDGSDREVIVDAPGGLDGITLDYDSGKLYWAYSKGNSMSFVRSNLDGSDPEEFLTEEEESFSAGDIAFNSSDGELIWTDRTQIRKLNIGNALIEDALVSNMLSEVALDLTHEKIYWVDAGLNRIRRAHLDGSDMEDFLEIEGRVSLQLDVDEGQLYWAHLGSGSIQRVQLDGTDIEEVMTLGPGRMAAFFVEPMEGKLYWTDPSENSIRRAHLDGTQPEVFFTPEILAPYHDIGSYVSVDPIRKKVYWLHNIMLSDHLLGAYYEGWPYMMSLALYSQKSIVENITLSPDRHFLYLLNLFSEAPYSYLEVRSVEGNPVTPFYDLLDPTRLTWMAFDWRYITQPGDAVVDHFTLIDTDTGRRIPGYDPIEEGAVLDLSQLPPNLNIRADVLDRVESVQFDLNGESNRLENVSPYTLFGDLLGDYHAGTPLLGKQHNTLTATAYTEDRAEGEAGTPVTLNFTVYNGINITGLTLVDADSGSDLMTLADGDTLDLDALPARINVKAEALSKVHYVRFELDPDAYTHTETVAPFTLFGDIDGRYLAGSFTPGEHTLKAIPYEGRNFSGEGPSFEISFTVTSSAQAPGKVVFGRPIMISSVPDSYRLDGNYPNPFNPVTSISYALPEASHVRLSVFDTYGRLVRRLVDQTQPAGIYEAPFDGSKLASGSYIYRLEAGPFTDSKLMLLLK